MNHMSDTVSELLPNRNLKCFIYCDITQLQNQKYISYTFSIVCCDNT